VLQGARGQLNPRSNEGSILELVQPLFQGSRDYVRGAFASVAGRPRWTFEFLLHLDMLLVQGYKPRMAEIFGVDEELWCSVLIEVLKQLEVRKKERDKEGEPIVSEPAKLLSVEHTFDRLDVIAYLDGEPTQRVHMRIGITGC
jgi:hypothetical protein